MNIQKLMRELVAGNAWKEALKVSLAVVLCLVVFVFLMRTVAHFNPKPKYVPGNFVECVAAGYPVRESYPRQCGTGDITFVENVR
jgi:hypothetical protein